MSKLRIPDHIREVAKEVVVLNVEVASESKLLEEDADKVKMRRERLQALSERLDEHEKKLLEACRDWVRHKS